jgi:phage protein D
MGQTGEELLINGEVTALEGEYERDGARLVVRGYDLSHRLVAGRHTETYRDVTDADIGRAIAERAGVEVGQIDETTTTHAHISQANQSDWDFLLARAREIGYDMGVLDGKLYFKRPSEASEGPGEGDYRARDPLQLVMGTSLLSFYPRVTAAQQVSEVEVRGWDMVRKEAVVSTAAATIHSAQLKDTPTALARVAGNGRSVVAASLVVAQGAADDAAAAEAERVGSSSAEAEGVARGHPHLKAGTAISVSGVAETFSGRYTLTHTRHVFDDEGYRTEFVVSGRQDRSLLGLASNGSGARGDGEVGRAGVVVAIVTDNADPEGLGRVKLAFPWLDAGYESDWARVVQTGAGKDRGTVIMPEVNDEVLVTFEGGDVRRPYVLGGLYNGVDTPPTGDDPLFDNGEVTRRGFVSRHGHRIVFLDADGKSGIALVSGDDSLRFALKQSDRVITLHSDGKISISSQERIEIESSTDISFKAGTNLELEGSAGVKIKSSGIVDIDGSLIQLN